MQVYDELNQPEQTDSRTLSLYFLPSCFVAAWILSGLGLVRMITFGFTHWFHEFGHSFAAWLGSRASIPLIGFAPTSFEKSWNVYLCFLFLIGLLAWKSWIHRIWPLLGLSLVIFFAQQAVTFFFSSVRWEMFMVYGGIAGEFVFSTLFLLAFHVRLPAQTYWSFLRWIVSPFSVFSFWMSFKQWREIAAAEAFIPFGSMWGGPGDSNGDMNRLRGEFGFSPDQITQIYMHTAWLCIALIVAGYTYFAIKNWKA